MPGLFIAWQKLLICIHLSMTRLRLWKWVTSELFHLTSTYFCLPPAATQLTPLYSEIKVKDLNLNCSDCKRQTQKTKGTSSWHFTSVRLPKDDVAMSSDVLPPINGSCPVSSWPDSKHGITAVWEGLEVPLLRLKHVLDTICAHGHHHLCAGLEIRD